MIPSKRLYSYCHARERSAALLTLLLSITACHRLSVTQYTSGKGSFDIFNGRTPVALGNVAQAENGVVVTIIATDLTPGAHAVHIHQSCHGADNPIPGGRLPNIEADAARIGKMETIIPGAKLRDVIGKYLVIHKGKDYPSTDPEMNAQGSVGCGRIEDGTSSQQIARKNDQRKTSAAK